MSAAALLAQNTTPTDAGHRRRDGGQHLPLRHLPADPGGHPPGRRARAGRRVMAGRDARQPPHAAEGRARRRRRARRGLPAPVPRRAPSAQAQGAGRLRAQPVAPHRPRRRGHHHQLGPRDGPGLDDDDADDRRRRARRRLGPHPDRAGPRPIPSSTGTRSPASSPTAGAAASATTSSRCARPARPRARCSARPRPRSGASPSTRSTTEPGVVIHAPTGRRLPYGQLVDKAQALPVPAESAAQDARTSSATSARTSAARRRARRRSTARPSTGSTSRCRACWWPRSRSAPWWPAAR